MRIRRRLGRGGQEPLPECFRSPLWSCSQSYCPVREIGASLSVSPYITIRRRIGSSGFAILAVPCSPGQSLTGRYLKITEGRAALHPGLYPGLHPVNPDYPARHPDILIADI